MGSDQPSARLDLQNAHPQNFTDALNLLAVHDGAHLNQQFIDDLTKLTGKMLELQNKGVLPQMPMDNGSGSGSSDYVRTASVQENAPAPGNPPTKENAPAGTASGDTHSGGGTWDSLTNGATADVLRGAFDGVRAGGDLLLAPVNGVYQGIKGGVETEWNGLTDIAHGDILGGVGNMVAAPFVGAWDGVTGVTGELWDGTKNIWHGVQNDFNAVTHTARGLFDAVRAGADIGLAPVVGAWDTVTGTVGSEITGVKDLAHGDVVGAAEHIVGAPIIGAVHGVEGTAHKLGNAAKNVWHGIENIL